MYLDRHSQNNGWAQRNVRRDIGAAFVGLLSGLGHRRNKLEGKELVNHTTHSQRNSDRVYKGNARYDERVSESSSKGADNLEQCEGVCRRKMKCLATTRQKELLVDSLRYLFCLRRLERVWLMRGESVAVQCPPLSPPLGLGAKINGDVDRRRESDQIYHIGVVNSSLFRCQ